MNILNRVCTAFVVVLTGCAAPQPAAPVDVGSAPVNHEATILAYLRETLRDPQSIQDFRTYTPMLSTCVHNMFYPPFQGWAVMTEYNAKNAFGGYVGRRTYLFWFRGERLMGTSTDAKRCEGAGAWR